jgi:hypothetical protein
VNAAVATLEGVSGQLNTRGLAIAQPSGAGGQEAVCAEVWVGGQLFPLGGVVVHTLALVAELACGVSTAGQKCEMGES